MKDLETKINNSEFVKTLAIKTKVIFANHLKLYVNQETRPKEDIETYGSDSRERQLKKIFKKYCHITDYFEKQLLCRKMINSDSVSEYCAKNNITEKEYYQYHYENFIITTISLLDLLAGLGNIVYNLGLKERKCNPTNYNKVRNRDKQSSALILIAFEKHLKKIKFDRNIIIHAGGFQSEKISSIDSKIFDNELIPMDNLLLDWFNDKKKEEVKKLVDSMDSILNDSLNFTFRFLDSLLKKLNKI